MTPDLRFAARLLAKSPLFTVAVIALLAAGIAANTVIFSVVDALLLRPLPVRDPGRLVRLVTVREPLGARSEFLYEEYEAWKSQVAGFEDLLAWSEQDMYVAAGEATERSRVHFTSDNFFTALGARPALGRLLAPEDDDPRRGGAPAVVLSYPYWQRRFAGDAGVLGKRLELDGRAAIVVGVSAKGFNGLTVETGPDLRAPVGWLRTMQPNLYENKIYCEVAARLQAGVAAEAVRAEAEAVWSNGWKERNKSDPGLPGRFELEPASRGVSRMRTQFSSVLWLLMGGAALLMLMVCANVAGLLIARTAGRRGELAVRAAMGATRLRLARQLFCESLLLTLGGAAGAVALSLAAIPLVVKALPPVRDFSAARLALTLAIEPDWTVLGFAAAVSAATVLLFGLVPALLAVRGALHPLLKTARAGGGWRGRQALVALQMALCTILLAGAGLTILTLRRLERMDAGFERDRIVTFSVDPDMARYKPAEAVQLRSRLMEGARALPGVAAASASSRGLMRGTGIKGTFGRAGERAGPGDFLNTSVHGVSPDYFQTMRIPWVGGRNFTGREDFKQTPKPVVVNQAFVRRFGIEPGGKFGDATVNGEPAKPLLEVIGVVGDAKYRSLREPIQPTAYQLLVAGQGFIVHVRTHAAPEQVIAPMRKLLAALDPRLSYLEVTTLASEVAASIWPERVAAFLATAFSAGAALIAAAGLYALLAFAVMQRRREIGIRVALGALPRDVARLMLLHAAALAAAGIAAGLACVWAIAPRIAAILYEVDPHDARPMLAAAAVALAVAAIAAIVPSLRAARIHPAAVLRQEE